MSKLQQKQPSSSSSSSKLPLVTKPSTPASVVNHNKPSSTNNKPPTSKPNNVANTTSAVPAQKSQQSSIKFTPINNSQRNVDSSSSSSSSSPAVVTTNSNKSSVKVQPKPIASKPPPPLPTNPIKSNNKPSSGRSIKNKHDDEAEEAGSDEELSDGELGEIDVTSSSSSSSTTFGKGIKRTIIEGQEVTSIACDDDDDKSKNETDVSEEHIVSMFTSYITNMAIELFIPHLDEYCNSVGNDTSLQHKYLLCAADAGEFDRIFRREMNSTISQMCIMASEFKSLISILQTCSGMKIKEVISDGTLVNSIDNEMIPETEIAYELTLEYDRRKFARENAAALLGKDRGGAKYPIGPAIFILGYEDHKEVAQHLMSYITFPDYVRKKILEFRDKHCTRYMEAYVTGKRMSLHDMCSEVVDKINEQSEEEEEENEESSSSSSSSSSSVGIELLTSLYEEYMNKSSILQNTIGLYKDNINGQV